MQQETQDIITKISVHGILACLGGVARHLSNTENPKLVKTLIEGLIATFVGMVFFFLAYSVSESLWWTALMASLGGWVGPKGMDWIFEVVKSSVKFNKN